MAVEQLEERLGGQRLGSKDAGAGVGSLNGSVVYHCLPRSHTTGGFRHSSIVVQMENVGANSYPSTTRFAPSRTPMSSMDENSRSAA